MPKNNDDLFAGFTVGNRQIPSAPQQAVIAAGIDEKDADLFEGFSIGGSEVPASDVAPVAQQEVVQPAEEVAQPLSEAVPEVVSQVAAKAGEAIEQITAPETGVGDFFTGSERIAATPELGTAPEFGTTPEADSLAAALSGGDTDAAGKISLGLISTFDEKAQMDIIQDAIPEVEFERTPDGSVFIEVPTADGGTRRSVLNRPGFSKQDARTALAQIAAFWPGARLAALGNTLLRKIGIGAVGAGATEQGLQEVGVELGRTERDPTSTAIAAVTGGLSEAVVPAVQAVRQSRNASRVGAQAEEIDLVAGNVAAAREAAEETGIPLFQAQQTGIPSQLERQSFIASLPAGTQSAVTGLRTQNRAAGDAVEDFLGSIAPDEAVVTGAERFRTASQNAVRAIERIRSEAASPIYKQAFRRQRKGQLAPIDTAQIELKMSRISQQFDQNGQIARNMNSALQKIENANGNLQMLHLAKIELDQTIEAFGADAVGNTTKRFLTDIKTDLVNELVGQSPSYRAARDEFIRLSPEVTRVRDSIIGKVANLDDTQLKQVSGKIFDAGETNPTVVANARRIISDVDPGAWNEILRVELEKRLGAMSAQTGEGSIQNIPGQLFRALGFNSEKKTRVLRNSLDEEGRRNLSFLETALDRGMQGRPGGSQTAAREEIKKELRGGVVQSIRNFISSPLRTTSEIGEDMAFNNRVRLLARTMYDPQWRAEMGNIRRLNPNSPAAARAMTQLLNDIESTEVEK